MNGGYAVLKALYDATDESSSLVAWQNAYVQTILDNAESHKGVLTALITSLVKKVETPEQDIRLHKEEFDGGYSARGYDTKYITPFMRDHFPRFAMAESGWLTRSIEQPSPFTKNFSGKIRNITVKSAFLEIIHDVQENSTTPQAYLLALVFGLKKLQEQTISVIHPQAKQLTVHQILFDLEKHFHHPYKTRGASRLPVLALYATYLNR